MSRSTIWRTRRHELGHSFETIAAILPSATSASTALCPDLPVCGLWSFSACCCPCQVRREMSRHWGQTMELWGEVTFGAEPIAFGKHPCSIRSQRPRLFSGTSHPRLSCLPAQTPESPRPMILLLQLLQSAHPTVGGRVLPGSVEHRTPEPPGPPTERTAVVPHRAAPKLAPRSRGVTRPVSSRLIPWKSPDGELAWGVSFVIALAT